MIHFTTMQKLYFIFFTSYPYDLFNSSNRYGNMGLAGVGLGLIHAQKCFWIANIGTGIFIYNIKNEDFIYYNVFILFSSIFLYKITVDKIVNLVTYI